MMIGSTSATTVEANRAAMPTAADASEEPLILEGYSGSDSNVQGGSGIYMLKGVRDLEWFDSDKRTLRKSVGGVMI